MPEEQGTLIVTGEEDAVKAITAILTEYGLTPHATQRRNLDGAAVTSWLVMALIMVKTAPDILRAIADLVKETRIGRVELDLNSRKIVIENPRPGQVEELVKRLEDGGRGDDA